MKSEIDENQRILTQIATSIEKDLTDTMNRSGMMYRLFMRVKTLRSIEHKMQFKGELYRQGKAIMQDIIGFRIVVYFQDDVDVLNMFLSSREVVRKSEDELDQSTFRPQRLNITRALPRQYVESFRRCIPPEYSDFIGSTYEVQIRTIFSEGWHEVEHDLRYKCKDDWRGCESYSRTLNGVIATLETAEWSMKSLFHNMAYQNYANGNYRAMLRNKLRIRLLDDDFSEPMAKFLKSHDAVVKGFLHLDRMVFLLTLFSHKSPLRLTFDNIIFLANRLESLSEELRAIESDAVKAEIDSFLLS